MKKSLQDLQRSLSEPYTDSLTRHYLRLFSRGKLNASHGDAIRHLQQVGALDANRRLTARGSLTVKEIRDAQNKKTGAAEKDRKADELAPQPARGKKSGYRRHAPEDGDHSPA